MRKLTLLLLVTFLSSSILFAQETTKLIKFTNSTAKFTVPAGSSWEIVNIFSQSIGSKGIYQDDNGYVQADVVRVFLKSINGEIMTDLATNKLGPVYFRGPNHERTQHLPLVLPEGTVFELLITSGDYMVKGKSKCIPDNALTGYISLRQTENSAP
ncbi:MAG: hypothetical protein ACI837_001289 [Crocinitomicaceae bacterium]|jgi:hypothetical protein